jgi:ribonuclease HII
VYQADLFSLESEPDVGEVAYTAGVDEVGRGPLVGDVVAAAVVLAADCPLVLDDSKKLNEKRREALAEQIEQHALAYAIGIASAEEIDHLNILQATLLAMQRAVHAVKQQLPLNQVLVDGNRCPPLDCPCEAIVKGDALVPSISAASILAKVYRDKQMLQLDTQFPHYGFAQHKGYPTASHLAAMERYGLIEGYRTSFKPVKKILQSMEAPQ